jgi:mannose-6-phosphate isomerase
VVTVLRANRPERRFYRGGARIARWRGESVRPDWEPEDWVASTTTVLGEARQGLTALTDGTLLRDVIAADPVAWLGADHVARWGADTQLLVKLLDAGQRLPVHAHPDDGFAAHHLGHRHGKAEAWYILEGGVVHLGLRRDVTTAELAALVAQQRTDDLLDLLHEVDVAPGTVVWVPPGELHAIGAGVVLLELQQPEDLSILLEWKDFAIDGAAVGHLGLGFDVALGALNLRARRAPLAELISTFPTHGELLPHAADRYFRLERHRVSGVLELPAGFAVLAVVDGELRVGGASIAPGQTAVTRAGDGPIVLHGVGELLLARPPRPSAGAEGAGVHPPSPE